MSKFDFRNPLAATPPTVGNSLFLLGTAIDGPIMEPVLIKNPQHAAQVFGDRTQGTLVKAAEQAWGSNPLVSIYLMRITGKSATLEMWGRDNGDYVPILTLTTVNGGKKYNDFTAEWIWTATELNLAFNLDGQSIMYRMSDFLTLQGLSKSINDDCRGGLHPIMMSIIPDYEMMNPYEFYTRMDMATYQFQYGDDGLNVSRDDLYITLYDAYNLLLGRQVDVIVPVGVYVDDVHPVAFYGSGIYGKDFYASNRDYLQLVDTENNNAVCTYHEQLIDFCRNQMLLGYMSHGVIGMRPLDSVPDNVGDDNSYIVRLVMNTAFRTRYGMTETQYGNVTDKGYFISVVASEGIYQQGTPNEYFDNGAVTYAALLTGRYDTTTNVQVSGIDELRYEFSDEVQGQLASMGVVTFRDSVRNGIVVTSGVTASDPSTDLHQVANVRMIQLSVAYANKVCDELMQEDIVPTIRRQILQSRIDDTLSDLMKLGVLDDYDYRVVMTTDGSAGMIILNLATKYSVESIEVSASISNVVGA